MPLHPRRPELPRIPGTRNTHTLPVNRLRTTPSQAIRRICRTLAVALFAIACHPGMGETARPNILFIFSDDHAVNAISAYGGRLAEIAPTPNIDRIARQGALFHNSFCANAICGPSRATILTGKHSHKNGYIANGGVPFPGNFFDQWTIGQALKDSGYTTAVIGKWHLPSRPQGFDHWEILPGQGNYYNPVFLQMDKSRQRVEGYATDITTDKSIAWLNRRDKQKPFFLMCQHKAPHRTFAPPIRHLDAFRDVPIPEPDSLFDDYAHRISALRENEMEIDRHMDWAYDLKLRKDEMGDTVLPGPNRYPTVEYDRMNAAQRKAWDAHFGPENQAFLEAFRDGKMTHRQMVQWKYQRYMKNYLATVRAVDDSVGRMLDYLDANNLADNTMVIYASDQGFYLGEHGWYDKRWMFEESLKMPFIIRWPGVTQPEHRPMDLIQNIDYAPTFADAAGIPVPPEVQGKSIRPILARTESRMTFRDAIYYAYYERGEHNVPQHFGIRTHTHKLMFFPDSKQWQLFDLITDPHEMTNIYDTPEAEQIQSTLRTRYQTIREEFQAPGYDQEPFAISHRKRKPRRQEPEKR